MDYNRPVTPEQTVHAARLASHLKVVRPPGDGPFPVVIQLHGCGGLQPLQFAYAKAASDAGVAAVVVDSFAPRAITRLQAHLTVCTGMRLRGAERAIDVLAALDWLERQPWADAGRVAAAGWSHGAWTLMDALAGAIPHGATGADPMAGLKAAILFYPYAGPPSRTHRVGWGMRRPKVFACLAEQDAVVGVARPRRALDRLAREGLDVQTLMLAGATHSFDDDAASDPRTRYDPDLAARARGFYVGALKETLGV